MQIAKKKYAGESSVISVRLPKDMVRDLDQIAAHTGRTRNELLTISIEFALNHRIIRQMVWDRFLTSDYSLRRVRRGGIYDIESGKRSCDDILGEYFEKEKYLAEK